jgi:ribosomal protein S18 acetylase RimI-like enzyme
MTAVTIHYLELTREAFKPKFSALEAVAVRHARIPSPEMQHFFYRAVGGAYHWTDRLRWTREQWLEAARDEQLHVLYIQDTAAGYFSLQPRDGDVNIVHFGLLSEFAGQGLGAHMLSVAVERAFAFGTERVTLNTCSLDGEHALKNYLARGFKIVRTEVVEKQLLEVSPAYWTA